MQGNNKSKKKKLKGFTLIELLIVITILAFLIIIIAIPIRIMIENAKVVEMLVYEASLHRNLEGEVVGWWKFDEGSLGTCEGGKDICDISKYKNHGTIYGTTAEGNKWVDGVSGKKGNALSFNGIDDYVDVSSNASLSFGEGVSRTITLWHYDLTGPISGSTALLAKDGGTKREWALYFGNRQFSLLTFDNAGTPTTLTQSSPIQYEADQWNFVVAGYDSVTRKMFLQFNGNSPEYSGIINDVVAGNQDVTIGGSTYYLSQPQLIDDVRIYSRTLTAEEIETMYTEKKYHYLVKKEN